MNPKKSVDNISLIDALGVTLPSGTAFRSVAQMLRKVGVAETVNRLRDQALESGRSPTFLDATKFAVGRVEDVQHFLNGEETEVEAYRKLRAEERGQGSINGTTSNSPA